MDSPLYKIQRDKKLPQERQKIMNMIEEDLLADENVVGFYYGGSIGTRNTDTYSDIDLRIVVKVEYFEAYRLHKKDHATKWGKVLFHEDIPSATHTVTHYTSFIKVDSFYYTLNDISPSIWVKDILIKKDLTGKLNEVKEQSSLLHYSPTEYEIESWISKFLANCHELYRAIKREETYLALSYLDKLRLAVVAGWYMEMGKPPNHSGYWAGIEGDRSPLAHWQRLILREWHSDHYISHIEESFQAIIPHFSTSYCKVCELYDVKPNIRRFKLAIDQIL